MSTDDPSYHQVAVSPPPQGQAVAEQDGAAQPEESPTAKFFETIKP